jgi:hypothetical protein
MRAMQIMCSDWLHVREIGDMTYAAPLRHVSFPTGDVVGSPPAKYVYQTTETEWTPTLLLSQFS